MRSCILVSFLLSFLRPFRLASAGLPWSLLSCGVVLLLLPFEGLVEIGWEPRVAVCGRSLLGVARRARVELASLHVYFGAAYRGQRKFSEYSRLDFISGETIQREGVA